MATSGSVDFNLDMAEVTEEAYEREQNNENV